MKNKYQEKAWSMLNKVEQNSLSLTLSQGLSSWEAGEIIGIAHYKYLEIKERSEKFFKLFVEFFEDVQSTSLFSPRTTVSPRFRDYIEACLEKRLNRAEAVLYSGDSTMIISAIHSKNIIKNMDKLLRSEDRHDQSLYRLIMEFDRWNNHRILPRVIQMPSAYKRRNNKRLKVYINYLNNFPAEKAMVLLELFWYQPKKSFKKRFWAAIISPEGFEEGYQVISIKDEPDSIKRLSSLYIYIFKEESKADLFGYLVTRFKEKTGKATTGQTFWPQYTDLISSALNYNSINNINFYIEKLDQAYKGCSSKSYKKNHAKRASSEIFYN